MGWKICWPRRWAKSQARGGRQPMGSCGSGSSGGCPGMRQRRSSPRKRRSEQRLRGCCGGRSAGGRGGARVPVVLEPGEEPVQRPAVVGIGGANSLPGRADRRSVKARTEIGLQLGSSVGRKTPDRGLLSGAIADALHTPEHGFSRVEATPWCPSLDVTA